MFPISMLKLKVHKNFKLNNIDFISTPHHNLINVWQSIHLDALQTDNFTRYSKLISNPHQPEHSVHNFKKLQVDFDIQKLKNIRIKYEFGYFCIQDGCHRLACLLYYHPDCRHLSKEQYILENYPQDIDFKLENEK